MALFLHALVSELLAGVVANLSLLQSQQFWRVLGCYLGFFFLTVKGNCSSP